MKTKVFVKILTFLCMAAFASLSHAGLMFSASLDGDQQNPPIVTLGSGMAMGELSGTAGSYVFTYTIDYVDLSSPIIDIAGGGHFHNAPMGTNGGVRHLFDTDSFAFLGTTEGTIMGDWRYDDGSNPLTDDLANELRAGNIYINLHTENFNSGEIRGQLNVVSEPAIWIMMTLGLLMMLARFVRR